VTPSFWQFLHERWGRILIGFVCWTAASFLVIPRLPVWAQVMVYCAIACWFAYQLGAQSERARAVRELEKEIARIDRVCRALNELTELVKPRENH